jgi:hypothetical protein
MEYDIPPDAPVQECPYCDRPFPDADQRAMHVGVDHPEEMTDDERAAFEEARAAEYEDLRQYRIVAVGVLVLLYFGLLLIYALV